MAKIAGVGLAKLMNSAAVQSSDLSGETFAYAAPELIVGSRCTVKVRSYIRTRPMDVERLPGNWRDRPGSKRCIGEMDRGGKRRRKSGYEEAE